MKIKNMDINMEVANKFFENLNKKDTIKFVTHHGLFHADDVCCAAMISNLYPDKNIEVIRTRENIEDFDIMLDVGRSDEVTENQLRLDHHQDEAKENTYDNKVRACALAKFAEVYYGDDAHMHLLRKKLLYPVSANDNGQEIENLHPSPFAWVKYMNPNGAISQKVSDGMFCKAVEIARVILKKIEDNITFTLESKPIWDIGVLNMSIDGIIVLEQGMPWMEYLFGSDVEDVSKFVIFPHATHGWVLRTIPTKEGGYVAKYPLPYGWWGTTAQDNKFDGMEFCHNTGFMAVFTTKEQAIAAAEYVISQL